MNMSTVDLALYVNWRNTNVTTKFSRSGVCNKTNT